MELKIYFAYDEVTVNYLDLEKNCFSYLYLILNRYDNKNK